MHIMNNCNMNKYFYITLKSTILIEQNDYRCNYIYVNNDNSLYPCLRPPPSPPFPHLFNNLIRHHSFYSHPQMYHPRCNCILIYPPPLSNEFRLIITLNIIWINNISVRLIYGTVCPCIKWFIGEMVGCLFLLT